MRNVPTFTIRLNQPHEMHNSKNANRGKRTTSSLTSGSKGYKPSDGSRSVLSNARSRISEYSQKPNKNSSTFQLTSRVNSKFMKEIEQLPPYAKQAFQDYGFPISEMRSVKTAGRPPRYPSHQAVKPAPRTMPRPVSAPPASTQLSRRSAKSAPPFK